MMPFVNRSHIRRFVSVPFLTAMMLMAIAAPGRAKDVTLAWDPSPDENVDHYVVYWGIESGNYTQNSPPIKDATSYTVEGLEDGVDYYFAAKAVGATGLESDFSNEAAIPRIDSPEDACIINGEDAAGYPIQGRAAAFAAVEIFLDASPLATTTASEDGRWSVSADLTSIPEKAFELKAVSTGAESSLVDGYYDKTAPLSQIIDDMPTMVQGLLRAEFNIRWTASDEASSIDSTELWVKNGADGVWEDSGLSPQEGDSGVFAYQPALGDGMYYFATRTSDSAGNVEEPPAGNGETSTLLQAGLSDAIMALKVLAGIEVDVLNKGADINGDKRIGIQEAIHFMRTVARLNLLI